MPRIQIRNLKGVIVPCRSCAKVFKCSKYFIFTRYLLRHGEYSHGTNILDYCDLFTLNKSPGKKP